MIERLAARARREGLTEVSVSVMDGHALDLEDDRFDVAGSQFGVMLFPDLPRGVRELVRVTRPGGRVLLVAYGPPDQVQFIEVFLGAMRAALPGFTDPFADRPPLPFQVADPAKLRRELATAGLRDVGLETITETLEFASGRRMWDWVTTSNPVAEVLVGDASEREREAIREALEDAVRERADDDGVARLTNPVHIAIGTA
jgi:ubiquinone/menaquinone biosynthesis C-methylase UbiE